MIVKQTFELLFKEASSEKRMAAIIYGSDANASAVASALKAETPGRF